MKLTKKLSITSLLFIFLLTTVSANSLDNDEDSMGLRTNDGQIKKLYRQKIEFFSMILPIDILSTIKTKNDKKKYLIPLLHETDEYFKMYFIIQLINKEKSKDFKEFILADINQNEDSKIVPVYKKKFEVTWLWDRFYELQKTEMKMTNAIQSYFIIGYYPKGLPIKTNIMRSYFLHKDNQKIIKISAYTIAEPKSDLYNNSPEVSNFMQDLYLYSKTIKFE